MNYNEFGLAPILKDGTTVTIISTTKANAVDNLVQDAAKNKYVPFDVRSCGLYLYANKKPYSKS